VKPLQVTYQMNRDDFIAFQRHVAQRQSASASTPRLPPWLMGFLLLMMIPMAVRDGGSSPVIVVGTIVSILLWAMSFWLGRSKGIVFVIAPTKKSLERAGVFEEQVLVLDLDELKMFSDRGATVSFWQSVDSVDATSEHLFIYTAPTRACVVPRRAFESDRDFQEFVDRAKHLHQRAGGTGADNCVSPSRGP
jgi:hypothetical protein